MKIIWSNAGADPEFLERDFICVKVCVCVWGGGVAVAGFISFFINIL